MIPSYQDDYVIDQTRTPIENVFWMIKTTTISLNKQLLSFTVLDISQNHTQFELKLYVISHEEVKELASMSIQTLTYVEVFLECAKSIFKQTVSICPEYTLEYQIYVHKSQIDLMNLIKDNEEQSNVGMKNAFKKKTHEIIEIQNQKVQIKDKKKDFDQKHVLRKSLYVNSNKLLEIKKRNQEIKDKSMSKNTSKSSFFSQIGDIFRPKPPNHSEIPSQQPIAPKYTEELLNASRSYSQEMKKSKHKPDSERSFSIHPPWITSNKYTTDGSVSEEDSLKILRQKQRLRIQSYENQGAKDQVKREIAWKTYFKMFRVIVLILILTFVVYYFSSVGKKGRYKMWRQVQRFVNIK